MQVSKMVWKLIRKFHCNKVLTLSKYQRKHLMITQRNLKKGESMDLILINIKMIKWECCVNLSEKQREKGKNDKYYTLYDKWLY